MSPASGRAQSMGRTSGRTTNRGGWYDLADLGCAGLSVGLAIASVRLFSNTGAVLILVAVGLGSWTLASVLRRTPLPGWAADLSHLIIGVFVLLVVVAPGQRWGFLPTPGSIQAVVTAVRHDFTRFDEDVAPLVAGVGHLVVMSALLWILALFNSTSAMRLRAPIQGVIPHLVAFVGLGFVARVPGRTTASAAMFVAVGIYVVTQVAWRNAANNWIPRGTNVAARSLAGGFAVVAVAGLVSAVVVPLLPGDSKPVVNLRRGGLGEKGPRTVVSPFVEVGANLGPRSNELLFEVESDTAQYWRLTALDTYDEQQDIWVLSNSYTPVDGKFTSDESPTTQDTLEVRGLGGIWIPTPEDTVAAEAPFGLNWDGEAESLIKRSGNLGSGDAVAIGTAGTPGSDIDIDELGSATPAKLPGELVDASGIPPQLAELASNLEIDSAYNQLLALQNYFHDNFTYDESVDLSGTTDPLAAFLELKRGFCQQFSTAFALGARSLGYPARVVVGFTPGDEVTDDSGSDPVFAVRGRHAHAWPEVRFARIGWVPFEPTPGRGNPATTSITGVQAAQAAPPANEAPGEESPSPTGTVPEPTTSPQPTPTAPDGTEQVTGAEAPPGADEGSTGNRRPLAIAVLAGLAVLVAAAALAWRRRSKHDPAPDPHPVARQWKLATDAVATRGLTREGFETPTEFARRCDARLDVPEMIDLAAIETIRLWSPLPTEGTDVAAAVAAGAAVTRRVEELEDAVPGALASGS